MKLNESDKQFIRHNQRNLSSLFKRRVEDLKREVFTMPPGEERDRKIDFIKEFQRWLETVKILQKEDQNEPLKEDYT